MEMDEITILREISHKLDQLIVLLKLSNQHVIDKFKKEVQKDRVSAKILELADGTLTYSELTKKVSEEIGVAGITVKRKISRLREMGFLIAKRVGKQVYYENSGLFE